MANKKISQLPTSVSDSDLLIINAAGTGGRFRPAITISSSGWHPTGKFVLAKIK
jgi:hypothetical protein